MAWPACCQTLDAALAFLETGGEIAIFDAANVTMERRRKLSERVESCPAAPKVVFIEAICVTAATLEPLLGSPTPSSNGYVRSASARDREQGPVLRN